MIKKITVFTFLSLFFFTELVFAANVPYFGTTTETNFFWANTSTGQDRITSVTYESCSSAATINFYQTVGTTATFISSTTLTSGTRTINPPLSTNALKIVSNDGGEVYLTQAATTNTNGTSVNFSNDGNCGNGSGDDGGSNGSEDCGCIFNTPGWGDYMGKIDDLIAAIPPAPNWGQVANTFRDSIVPKLIGDLDGLLGKAPSLPRAPSMPSGLDDGNLKNPTGKEDPGLKGFNSDDVKNQAPVIDEREDPTGGWDILDPIGQLPSQDDFKDNIPNEGDMIPPEVPEVEGEAPTPPQEDNPTPGAPKDEENKAPVPPQEDNPTPGAPKDEENKAPTPPEKDNPTPGAPKDEENKAPVPPKEDNPAPKPPKEEENRPPRPGEGGGSGPPIPGDQGGTGPIPKPDGSTGPVPGEDNSTAPIPNG